MFLNLRACPEAIESPVEVILEPVAARDSLSATCLSSGGKVKEVEDELSDNQLPTIV
jgi:hypothetical protein